MQNSSPTSSCRKAMRAITRVSVSSVFVSLPKTFSRHGSQPGGPGRPCPAGTTTPSVRNYGRFEQDHVTCEVNGANSLPPLRVALDAEAGQRASRSDVFTIADVEAHVDSLVACCGWNSGSRLWMMVE